MEKSKSAKKIAERKNLIIEATRLNNYKVPIIICTNQKLTQTFIEALLRLEVVKLLKTYKTSVVLVKTAKFQNIKIIEEKNVRFKEVKTLQSQIWILTTSKGILTNFECEKLRIGGKVIAVLQ